MQKFSLGDLVFFDTDISVGRHSVWREEYSIKNPGIVIAFVTSRSVKVHWSDGDTTREHVSYLKLVGNES